MSKIVQQCRYPAICIVLILLTFAAFGPVLKYGFVDCDDSEYVTENPHVKAGLTRNGIIWAFTTGHSANWHPLTWLSLMLDCQLFGVAAGRHHLVNLLIHTINAVLLFAVLKKMTGALWRSAFAAAAYALHPLHVESVAWIAERKDVLSGLFWILTMAAYLQYVKRPGKITYLLTVAVFALGLMAKPMLVTLPFVLLLLDFWPFERLDRHNLYRRVIEKAPLFGLSAISSVVTFLVQQRAGAVAQFEQVGLDSRLANAFNSYVVYIAKMIWPSRLAVFYPYPAGGSPIWPAVFAALLLLGVSICVIRLAANHKYLPTGWFWYIVALLPVIGLVQVGGQARADRYTYLPSIGIFIIAAWGSAELLSKRRYRKIILSISAVFVITAMVTCTRMQVQYWRNSSTLFTHAMESTENNYVARAGLGKALRAQGKIDEAINQYRQSLQIKQNYAVAHYNLGNALSAKDRVAEAVVEYREAVHIDPNYASAYTNLGSTLAMRGELDEAIICLRKAVQLNPQKAGAHYNLGYALELNGSFDEALSEYRRALQINPDHAGAKRQLDALSAKQKAGQ